MRKEIVITTILAALILTTVLNANVAFSVETPLVYVDPATVTGLSPSQSFTIAVKIANVTGLYGFDIRLRWNPAILDYVSHTAKIPTNSFPGGVLYNPVFILKNEVNATEGTYWLAASSLDPAPVFTGNGVFFEMTFHVKAIGRCLLEIYSHDIADKTAQPIAHNAHNGFFSNYVATPAEIYVNPNKVIDADLTPGKNFSVDVNLDKVVELRDFEFSLGYNTTMLDVLEVTVNPVFPPPVTVEISEVDGLIRVAASASPYISGNIVLATITFNVTSTGDSVLDLHTITLIDDWGDPIPYKEPRDGFFSNVLRAKLFIDPSAIVDPSKLPGSQFSVDVKIDDVFDLYRYTFNLSYDTSILTCLGAVIFPPTSEHRFTTQISIDDEAGEIFIDVSYYSPAQPITLLSETRIVTIYFMVEGYGFTILDLHDTTLTNKNGDSIPHDVGDGFFQNLVADVAVIHIEASPNKVYSGRIVNVSVIAANVGDLTATFTVTAYYDNNTIGTLPVLSLPPDHNVTLLFVWNTTGMQPCSNFTLSAEASPVPYELDLTNNYLVEGWVKIKILGDVNGDGKVDIFDIVLATDAYGTREGDPKWNSEADVAPRYGVVDIFDMVTIAFHYGEHC